MSEENEKTIDNSVNPAGEKDEKNNIAKVPNIVKIEKYLLGKYDFRFNSITQTLEYKRKEDLYFSQFTDKAKRDIIIEIKKFGINKPSDDMDDILQSSLIPEFNPIAEYFNNIEYSGPGYIDELASCLLLEDPERTINGNTYRSLFASYFRRWLYACYLCSTSKTINDVMLILIGAQGRFKTSFLNYLTPNILADYRVCSHIAPSLTDYNTANFLAEKFFINVDDQMETIFGKDYNSMKAIISAPDITNRKLYRSTHQRRRRIANFCGSVNEPRFLRDSNNRRYLCFAIKDISPSYNTIDINAVWAEVKHEADSLNRTFIFGKEDYKMIDLMNANFEAPTEESETLQSIFVPADLEKYPSKTVYYMSFTEILKVLRDTTKNGQLKSYNLQTAMRKYGYETHSYKKDRFSKQPRNLYAVQIISDDPFYYNLVEKFQ